MQRAVSQGCTIRITPLKGYGKADIELSDLKLASDIEQPCRPGIRKVEVSGVDRRSKRVRKAFWVNVELFSPVLVANKTYWKGRSIPGYKTNVEKRWVDFEAVFRNPERNYLAKKKIRRGEILTSENTLQKKTIAAGDELILRSASGGIVVNLESVAISDADVGDTLQVVTLHNNQLNCGKLHNHEVAIRCTALRGSHVDDCRC
ncbi:flagella basal body P-ring formation protein FlgA [Microbulbifer sp. ALW1]|uniref:flagella basal body P-ring formation protein FlgA n=1 Tax=Microbulbifer sp. (strain ALW1) TaxID=1516059 RepID=UPI00135A83DE|nr:flagella basal body P-ring formation protein FlgA [Microbulbifer sp. ALW1]